MKTSNARSEAHWVSRGEPVRWTPGCASEGCFLLRRIRLPRDCETRISCAAGQPDRGTDRVGCDATQWLLRAQVASGTAPALNQQKRPDQRFFPISTPFKLFGLHDEPLSSSER